MTADVINALVPFGIAGLAIVAVVFLAMYPKNGRTLLLAGAIVVVCAIFGADRYLQNRTVEEGLLAQHHLDKIAEEIRSMDSSLIAKLNYETSPDVTWSLSQIKAVTNDLCSNVLAMYKLTGATAPARNCENAVSHH